MEKDILKTIQYFIFFHYPPAFGEIQRFFPRPISAKILEKRLKRLVKTDRLIEQANRYTPQEYKSLLSGHKSKMQTAKNKIDKVRPYLRFLALWPQIKLVGLSGSVAMMSAVEKDDIDLFIITEKRQLWTGRFIANIGAWLYGLKRQRGVRQAKDKVCLNLFFDEGNLVVPVKKRSSFVAHEVLQMKPLIDKDESYKRFLGANSWVFKLFPNAVGMVEDSFFSCDPSHLGNLSESILKKLQLYLINRHKTTEIITDTQLWFFPDDFEKKLPMSRTNKKNIPKKTK